MLEEEEGEARGAVLSVGSVKFSSVAQSRPTL